MERLEKLKISKASRLIVNPPEVILVFDNYRGPGKEGLSQKTMNVRAAVAAHLYNYLASKNELFGTGKPQVVSFAGEHEPDDLPGSENVAFYLEKFGISKKDIVTRRNTITTTTDLMELCAYMRANNFESAAIVTTDDHVSRTKAEIKNHFGRTSHYGRGLEFFVVSPSSEILKFHPRSEHYYPYIKIHGAVRQGKTGELSGGLTEKIATGIAKIPVRPVRIWIQKNAEARTHAHIPVELQRIQKASQRLST